MGILNDIQSSLYNEVKRLTAKLAQARAAIQEMANQAQAAGEQIWAADGGTCRRAGGV